MHRNCFLNYYKGHRDRVTSLSLSPVSDLIVSTSLDGTARFWDMATSRCQGRINVSQHSAGAFDPSGRVFAVVSDTPKEHISSRNMIGMDVLLYDIRRFEEGPFCKKTLELRESSPTLYSCVSVQFSNDGKSILISTDKDSLFMVDGFLKEDVPVRELSCSKEHRMTSLVHPAFSPDDKAVVAGTDDGALAIWNVGSGDMSVRENVFLSNPLIINAHPLPINAVSYNPRYNMLASGCACVGLWLPN